MNAPPGSPLRGNAGIIARDYRGWFLGHFMPDESPLHSTDLEVKWTVHTKGETRPQWSPPSPVRTLNLLVRGKFTVLFPEEEVTMQKEGDFVLFGPGIAHSFRCDEESLVLTLRWPSRA